MRDDRERLLDILESIGNIQKYSEKGRSIFLDGELLQVWFIYHLLVIAESAANISSELREHHVEIPWVDVISMRNVLVHHYFGIDLHQIWDTVEIDLPGLNSSIRKILREIAD